MVRRSLVLCGRLAVLAFAVVFAAHTASAQCPQDCGCVSTKCAQPIANPDHWNAPAIAMPHSWNAPLALPCADACPQCLVDCPESCESTGGCFSINGKLAQVSETRVEQPAKPLNQAEQIAAWLKKRHNPIVVVAERNKAAEKQAEKDEQLQNERAEVAKSAPIPLTKEAGEKLKQKIDFHVISDVDELYAAILNPTPQHALQLVLSKGIRCGSGNKPAQPEAIAPERTLVQNMDAIFGGAETARPTTNGKLTTQALPSAQVAIVDCPEAQPERTPIMPERIAYWLRHNHANNIVQAKPKIEFRDAKENELHRAIDVDGGAIPYSGEIPFKGFVPVAPKSQIIATIAPAVPHGVCPLPFDTIGATTPPDVAATILAGYTEAAEANDPPAPLADPSSDPHHSHVILASDEQDDDCPGSTPKSLKDRLRDARESAAGFYLEYGFTRPEVISRGPIESGVCATCKECEFQCRPVAPSIDQIGDEQGDDCPGSTSRRVTILDGAQFPAAAEWEALKQVRAECGPAANPAVKVSDFVQHGPYPVPQVIENPFVVPQAAALPQSPAPLPFAASTLSHTATVTDAACQPCLSGQCVSNQCVSNQCVSNQCVSGECDALDAIVRRLERNAPGCINSPAVPQTAAASTGNAPCASPCVGCAPGQCATCPGCGPQASYPTTRSVATATQSKPCCGENCACGDTCACGTKTAAAPKFCSGRCDATANCPCGQAANIATCGPTAIVAPRACPYAGRMPAVVALPDAFFENQQAPVNWPPHPPGSAFGPAPQFATPQYATPPQFVQQVAPTPYGATPSYSPPHVEAHPQFNNVPFDPYHSQHVIAHPVVTQPVIVQQMPANVFRTAGLPAQPKATSEAYQALKESIRQLEKMAAYLEEQKLYEQADRLRDSAAELRAKSRAMSSELDALPAESKPAVATETPPKFGACLPTAEGEKLAWRPNLDCVVPNMICENGICYPVTAPQLPTIEQPKPILPIAIDESFPIQTTSEDDQKVFQFIIGHGR